MIRKLGLYNKLSIILTSSGIILLLLSFFAGSSILVFAGLGILLWGVLFIIARPKPTINIEVLDLVLKAAIENIKSNVKTEEIKKIVYFPPYSKATVLPYYLENFRDGFVFFSYTGSEDTIKETAFQRLPEGVRTVPFGTHLVKFFERRLGVDFSEVDINYFNAVFPSLIAEELSFVREFSSEVTEEKIKIRLNDLIFDKSYSTEGAIILYAVSLVNSAIGLILAKISKNPLIIETTTYDPTTKIAEITFRRI